MSHGRNSSGQKSQTHGPTSVAPRSPEYAYVAPQMQENPYAVPPIMHPGYNYAAVPQAPGPRVGPQVGFNDVYDAVKNVDLNQIKEQLEGPKPMRVLAGLGGLALSITAALGLLNIFSYVTHPAKVALECYEIVLGIAIMVLEIKSLSPGLKDFLYRWFPFVSIVGGKGLFYIFAGSLGISFGWTNLLIFVPGVYLMVVGTTYVLVHVGQCQTLGDKYEQSMALSYMPSTRASHY